METAAEPPASLGKALVACLVCKLVKTLDQFHRDGCDNCYFLDMTENRNRCEDCTTINFQGIITVVDPKASWAAKWLHMGMPPPSSLSSSLSPALLLAC